VSLSTNNVVGSGVGLLLRGGGDLDFDLLLPLDLLLDFDLENEREREREDELEREREDEEERDRELEGERFPFAGLRPRGDLERDGEGLFFETSLLDMFNGSYHKGIFWFRCRK